MTPTPFTSLLVANRGEIALRIMRTARDLGLSTVAVYTDADADAPHVRMADRAVRIGSGPVTDSYLNADRIIAAALETGAGAIHPGYGFLSERADFAQSCADAGLVFVGPSPHAITVMGNKAGARQRMQTAGVPCVPGYDGDDQSDTHLKVEATRIGFPVMIKAALGGGGRGMRLVHNLDDFPDALTIARAEAEAGFGSSEVILERAILRPRHVEFQIFADRHGNVIHLGERDCSVQRRHQKVLEEAPCPAMTPDLRAEMGAAAVTAAQTIGYEGAGTVEFLLDDTAGFYFLEMNTRLQVEHPVTELVTGLDLVALQLSVAAGAPLPLAQSDVTITGHAIEARLYAEDPANNFLPATGQIALWHPPTGPGIRVDDGITTGQEVSPYYDPMLAKIIAYGSTRDKARQRLASALRDTRLFGPTCNRDFLAALLSVPEFAKGTATTDLIAASFGDPPLPPPGFNDIALAAGLLYTDLQSHHAARAHLPADLLGWSSGGKLHSSIRLRSGGDTHRLSVTQTPDGALTITDGSSTAILLHDAGTWRLDGLRIDLRDTLYDGTDIHIATGTRLLKFTHISAAQTNATKLGGGQITAPMHGQLLETFVASGDHVTPGTRLAILEAMKMQHEILAEIAGEITLTPPTVPEQVRAGTLLFEITPKD